MAPVKARKLQVGDKVFTDKMPVGKLHFGQVVEIGYNAAKIKWDDGQIGVTDFNDMVDIHEGAPCPFFVPRRK